VRTTELAIIEYGFSKAELVENDEAKFFQSQFPPRKMPKGTLHFLKQIQHIFPSQWVI